MNIKRKRLILLMFVLFIFVIGISYFLILLYWFSRQFSPEVDAAIINAIVTVPISLLTLIGTVGVTYYINQRLIQANLKSNRDLIQSNQEANSDLIQASIQSSRATMRDKILENRINCYSELFRLTVKISSALGECKTDIEKLNEYQSLTNKLLSLFEDNFYIFSQDIRTILGYYLVCSRIKENKEKVKNLARCKEKYYLFVNNAIENDTNLWIHVKKMNPEMEFEDFNELKDPYFSFELLKVLPGYWLREYFGIYNQDDKIKFVKNRILGYMANFHDSEIVTFSEIYRLTTLIMGLLQNQMHKELSLEKIEDDLEDLRNRYLSF